jgi:hypothetical protein
MTLMTGGTTSYLVGSAGGNREDLEDVIWELDPLDTYCLTNFDRVKRKRPSMSGRSTPSSV